MNPIILLVGALLAGGPRPPADPQEQRLLLDERAGRRLELVRQVRPETTPPMEGALELVEAGARRRLADRVGAAVLLPDGGVLAVRDGALLRLQGGKWRTLLAGDLAPELEIDPAGERVALVRRRAGGGSSIEVLELDGGGAPVTVVAGPGHNNAPAFAPDGQTLLFVSTRTGLSSVFRVGLDGQGERQLTNRGLKAVGPGFVPPPERVGARRFEGGKLTWTAEGTRWFADPATELSGRLEGGAR